MPKDSMSPEAFVDDFIERLMDHPLKLHNTDEFYYMTKDDIRCLYYFKEKTVYTIGTQQSVMTYRHEVVKLMMSVSLTVSSNLNAYCFFRNAHAAVIGSLYDSCSAHPSYHARTLRIISRPVAN